jgi:ABC transporter substrate binding protein (PQQ-dependent alcohol dehydrogenase system)
MFHVAPSDAMISSARAAVESSLPQSFSIELWHRSLERYGGSQLNDRYRARFNRAMSSPAWAGWVAVKIAWEASLRARSTDPAALVDLLEKDATQFDGHKGTPLSFRAWDHQLRQPLYAVSRNPPGERVVAELPDVGKVGTGSMRDQLDRFGNTAASGRCFPDSVR